MNLQVGIRETHTSHQMIKIRCDRVVYPANRSELYEKVGKSVERTLRNAACRREIAVFDYQYSAGLEDFAHLDQT